MAKVLIIDGNSIIKNSFYGSPAMSKNNAMNSFFNLLFMSIKESKADSCIIAFDCENNSFRKNMDSQYKTVSENSDSSLAKQLSDIKSILEQLSIPMVSKDGLEAIDIIGKIIDENPDNEYVVLTCNQLVLQFVSDNVTVKLYELINGKAAYTQYNSETFLDKYGISGKEIIDLFSITGNLDNNIGGIEGFGINSASALLSEYKSLENIIENADEAKIIEAKDTLLLNKKLLTVKLDFELQIDNNLDIPVSLFTEKTLKLLSQYELLNVGQFFDESANTSEDNNITIINTIDQLEEYINSLKDKSIGAALACHEKTLYGAAVCDGSNTVYIPCEGFINQDYLCEKLNELVHTAHIYTIDLKSQIDFLGCDIDDNVDDLAIMAYLLNPLNNSYSFTDIAKEYSDKDYKNTAALAGKQSVAQLAADNNDILINICAAKANTAAISHDLIEKELCAKDMMEIYTSIERPVIYVLRSMEKEGIRVNREALKKYGDELVDKIVDLEEAIYNQAGMSFNINSPKQLGEVLFEKLMLPSGKKTKTGYSTSADVLEKLADEYPIVNDILEYRTLAKLKSTYADGLADYIQADERIHGTFNQTITATGRISSTEPNLQNIPIRMELGRKIRKVFIPREGCVFVDADYSQIELRLLAHMSADATLINAYKEDSDIHRITASKVFKIPFAEVTQAQRSNAKAVNFGIVYGISSFGLSRDLSISRKEAKEYIEEYFKTYPSIKKYLDGLVTDAKDKGYSMTMYGRRRPVPELASSNFMQRQFGERVAMNSPLQGTAADIIKIAMINVYKRLKNDGLKSRLILQIHDELLIETAYGEEDKVRQILNEEMTGAANLYVPLVIDIHSGNDWYEAK